MPKYSYSIMPSVNANMIKDYRVMGKEVTKSLWDDRLHQNNLRQDLREKINIP